MSVVTQVAEIIWKIREELFLDGSPTHDEYLAMEYIKENGRKVDYIQIYMWMIELEEFINKI